MTIWIPELSENGPRYRALAHAIERAIDDGELAPGDKLPPQRRLADALGVTVGTVTRAYALVEQSGRVSAQVGSGTYVHRQEAVSAFADVIGMSHDGLVDLGMSLPPPHPERQATLGRLMSEISAEPATLEQTINYPLDDTMAVHRQHYADWLGQQGLTVDPKELLITQGGMNGIALALSALLSPNDRLAAEALSYPGVISAARQQSLKMVAVPFDDEGIDVAALAIRHERTPFRALYVMPEHHNPTTVQLSEKRREALVALARERDFWLIEDGVMHLPQKARGTPLYQLAPERTIFLFSVAKILGGGLRSGIMRAPVGLLEQLRISLRNQCWAPPALMAEIAGRWLASNDADRLLSWQFEELEARQAMVREALGDFDITMRRGGFYAWLVLPGEHRAARLVETLEQEGVRVAPAEAFCVGSTAAPQAIRICLSAAPDRAALSQALNIIVSALSRNAPPGWQTV
ncbi:PLP-dependent aminotransferase family protein [Kushneria marisflavi]|uniref:GntR family transcriptional regulator n=1 Tax=Kushneria marisflavi TaxID=157779 RepID=A0A240UNX9_9GAMM|nr:PLP-dependent aminotransferase family protein [Kushneria marisflavi]ART63217.1 GntR family transcriptional regulator [Kushneria marisflavi]RKD84245.1 GntR family transcriptional regulator [Kushneria marisflavi]